MKAQQCTTREDQCPAISLCLACTCVQGGSTDYVRPQTACFLLASASEILNTLRTGILIIMGQGLLHYTHVAKSLFLGFLGNPLGAC